MKKMKTLFIREFENHGPINIKNKVEKGCEWVINGEGVATRKYDGTCCLIQDNKIYGRYDYKEGRTLPINAIPCQEKADAITGHFPHWVLCDENNPNYKWHILAFNKQKPLENGTYELCGIHFQNNIDKLCDNEDILIKHGVTILDDCPRDFDGIKNYLATHYIEGIVFHRGNGEMCKIKRSDFGFEWQPKGEVIKDNHFSLFSLLDKRGE